MVMQAAVPPDTTPAQDIVPLAQPYMNGREVELVADVVRSGCLAFGPMLARFEQMFAEAVGASHAVAVSSATAALHVAAHATGWGSGDEIVTSPLAAGVGANLARATGATVRYADIDPTTLSLDVSSVAELVGSRTRGIVPVEVLGVACEAREIDALARQHGLTVLRDACGSLGACEFGWSTVFEFADRQPVAIGPGAMLCTDDDELAATWRHEVGDARLGDVPSAVGVAQLEKLPRVLVLRQMVAAEYVHMLSGVAGVTVPPKAEGVVLLAPSIDRDVVMARLAERGVETSAALTDPTELGVPVGACPVSESVARRSLALPFFPAMSPQQQERVVHELRDVLAAG